MKYILHTTLSLILVAACVASSDAQTVWHPLSPAPSLEWGSSLTGEYDSRKLDSDPVKITRATLSFGRAVTSYLAVWGEGGLSALKLTTGNKPAGDYGPSFGVGLTAGLPEDLIAGWSTFATLRVGFSQSKLSDEQTAGVYLPVTRRSKFEWVDGWSAFGAYRNSGNQTLFIALMLRAMTLDETRTTSTSITSNRSSFKYDSGFTPGAVAGMHFQLPGRFHATITGEGATGPSWRVALSIGQWGTL